MKTYPVMFLLVAVMGALVGALHLWLWFSEAKPLSLYVALAFLIPIPLWIMLYRRTKRAQS